MYISPYKPYNTPVFRSNTTKEAQGNKSFLTSTYMYRPDSNWNEMSAYFIRHFKDHEKVNLVQFAASDGSEAYTQIISLLESKKDVDKFFPIKAYDISDNMVEAANSGLINLHKEDVQRTPNFYKYFNLTDKKLKIDGDIFNDTTYEVKNILKNKVQFQKGDMFEMMKNFKDESNSLILCRNLLMYFENNEIKEFADTLAEKLKKGSLFVIGLNDVDATNIEHYLLHRNFMPVFDGIYRKI